MTDRQCCGKYRDPKQRNRMEYMRDWVRCRNRASITIYGGMPLDNDQLPWVAFVCKKHAETAFLSWVEIETIEDVINLLTPSEIDEYLALFFNFDAKCINKITAWGESKLARAHQCEALISRIEQSAEEVRNVLRDALKKYKQSLEVEANV